MDSSKSLPVIIIGAGPVGLAAAAHLTVRNEPFLLFEAGPSAAHSILTWKHVRVFSPWRFNIDKAARTLLNASGWDEPDPDDLPTGQQLFDRYLHPLSMIPSIRPFIKFNSRVRAIGRKNLDKMRTRRREQQPFTVQVSHGGNKVSVYEAKAVIDASGTWHSPNPLGAGGIYAVGEIENSNRIFYGIPDISGDLRLRYKNKRVAVVGSGHSSINTLLELDKLKDEYPDTEIVWVLRKNNISDVYGGKENDALEARGALGIKIESLVESGRVDVYAPFGITQIANVEDRLVLIGQQGDEERALPPVDEIICNTGSRPDFSFLREVRLDVDPALESVSALAPLIDPNIHSCGTVRPHGENELRHPDTNFYIAGSKSYGRAPTFLMATGYEQVRSVVAAINGDTEAARKVELELPETGVCSIDAGACCSVPAESERNPVKTVATISCCG